MNPRNALSLIGLFAVMAALSSVAPAFSNRVGPVRNQPGERLLPPPPRRQHPIDHAKMEAADRKRYSRNIRNRYHLSRGGWVSTQSWLNRLARIEAAKFQ